MTREPHTPEIGPFVPEIRSGDPRWRSHSSQSQREMEELRLKLRDAAKRGPQAQDGSVGAQGNSKVAQQ